MCIYFFFPSIPCCFCFSIAVKHCELYLICLKVAKIDYLISFYVIWKRAFDSYCRTVDVINTNLTNLTYLWFSETNCTIQTFCSSDSTGFTYLSISVGRLVISHLWDKHLMFCMSVDTRLQAQISLSLLRLTYPLNHAHVLLGAAEVFGEIGDAEWLVLTRVNPSLVLCRPGDPVEEDPERFPHGLLTNWPNTHTHTHTQSIMVCQWIKHRCQELFCTLTICSTLQTTINEPVTDCRSSLMDVQFFCTWFPTA